MCVCVLEVRLIVRGRFEAVNQTMRLAESRSGGRELSSWPSARRVGCYTAQDRGSQKVETGRWSRAYFCAQAALEMYGMPRFQSDVPRPWRRGGGLSYPILAALLNVGEGIILSVTSYYPLFLLSIFSISPNSQLLLQPQRYVRGLERRGRVTQLLKTTKASCRKQNSAFELAAVSTFCDFAYETFLVPGPPRTTVCGVCQAV